MATLTDALRDTKRRETFLARYDPIADPVLLILAAAMIPLIVLPLSLDLSPSVDRTLFALDWVIWAVFAMDLTVRTYCAERRVKYLTTHWYDVLIVVVPFLRPLRLLRSARLFRLLYLSRAAALGTHAVTTAQELLRRNGLAFVLAAAAVLLLVAASLVFAFEHDANGSIDSFGTATWWAFVTITSVGYGDTVPVTAEGRIVAVFLMILGISLFGFITANIAAYMVEHQGRTSLDDVMTKLEGVERELTELRKELADRDGV